MESTLVARQCRFSIIGAKMGKNYTELYDKDMREPLFDFFEERLKKIRFLEEYPIGKSRADIVMIGEKEIVGFELKSDRDSFARLKRQMVDYENNFDRNFLVVGEHYAEKAKEILPEYWGIIKVYDECGDGIKAVLIRDAKKHPKKTFKNMLKRQMTFLWRTELIAIVKEYKLGGVSAKNKTKLRDVIISNLDIDLVKDLMIEQLMEREYPVYFLMKYIVKTEEIKNEKEKKNLEVSEKVKKTKSLEEGKDIELNIITNGSEIIACDTLMVRGDFVTNDELKLHKEIRKQLDEYFARKRQKFELPLEKKRMNSFYKKVYKMADEIPYGEVKTYSEVAKLAEKPKSYKTVGTACNRNPFKIFIPTHRIVNTSLKPAGVGTDLELKKILLDLEK